MKSTVLSFATVVAALAFGCATPRPATDHPPVEPYSAPSNNPSMPAPAEPAPATPPPAATPPSGTSGSGDLSSSVDSLRDRKDAIVSELFDEYTAMKGTTGTGSSSDEARDYREQRKENEQGKSKIEQDTTRLGDDVKEGVHSAVSDADRAAFTMRCEAVGKGETPIYAGDEQAKEFFARDDVKAKCAQAARIQMKINDVKHE